MLVLSRRTGEEIVIAGNIRVTVLSVRGDQVRLGIVAPRSVSVDRAEVHYRRLMLEGELDHGGNLSVAGQELCSSSEM